MPRLTHVIYTDELRAMAEKQREFAAREVELRTALDSAAF